MIKKPVTVLEYLGYFLAQRKKFIKKNITQSTFNTYLRRGGYLKEFLRLHQMENATPSEINIQFVREFETHLICTKGFKNDYSMKCIQLLGRIMRLALEFRDITSNPLDLFDYRYERNKIIVYLELSDIDKIKALKLNIHLNRTRNLFLFGCYTGLCYSDIMAFNYKRDLIDGPDGRKWIFIRRTKNNAETYVPLLKEAEEILKYYYYKLPKKSNVNLNSGLKDIAKMAKIDKVLTTHVARKTFGNILHNELNVSIETVSKLLGHKSLRTTQSWYVKTNLKKIASEMQGITFERVA